jgi:amino acid transporter
VLFSVSAILVADTVGASAAIGVQGLTFWIALAALFFVPYGLVTAELGSSWPGEGGIYVWVREAFGGFAGTMTSWLYWVNVAYWMPSVFVLFTGTLVAVYAPGLSTFWQATIVIALIWFTVGVGLLNLQMSKWVPNVAAAVKVLVLVGLGAMGLAYAIKHGTANSFTPSAWLPKWGDSWAFLPVIVYSYMGFELMNSAGGAIRRPQRDVPKAIGLAGAAILVVYLVATFGVLAAVPLKDVSIVTGIADALHVSFGSVFGGTNALYHVMIILLLFTFFGNMVTWSIGANHTMAATGLDRTAPAIFGHSSRRFGTPDYAFYLMGVIGTVLTVVNYGLFSRSEDVFWTIFAISSIIFLLPYLLMFPAVVRLRTTQRDLARPYRIPGGKSGLWLAAGLGELFIAATVFLFFQQVPEGTSPSIYWAITGGGTALTLLVGWALYHRSVRRPA